MKYFKYFVILAFVFPLIMNCAAQNSNEWDPFEKIEICQVKVYKNLLRSVSDTPSWHILKRGKRLAKDQIKSFIKVVTDTTTYGTAHFGNSTAPGTFDIIFFNNKRKIVFRVMISLDDNRLWSNPTIPATMYYKQKTGEYIFYLCGFSDGGGNEIRRLLHDFGILRDKK